MEHVAPKKCFVVSSATGCLTNLVETTTLRNSFNPSAYENVATPDEADVILVNTCGFNLAAEDASIGLISRLREQFPGKKVIVGGCLPGINPAKLRKAHPGDTLKIGEWHKLNSILAPDAVDSGRLESDANTVDAADLDTRRTINRLVQCLMPAYAGLSSLLKTDFQPLKNVMHSHSFDDKTYLIYVARGCLGTCSYCAIWHSKGRLSSKGLGRIRQEFEIGLEKGYKKFHLVADDVGCWGQDIGSDSAQLLRELLRVKGDYQIIIYYLDPTWLVKLYPSLREPLSDPRVICVNIPIQSGSSSLVKKMNRKYSVEEVLARIGEIKSANPSLAAKTHLMAGYPEETADDFRLTLRSVPYFDVIVAHKFAPRPGTKAAEIEDQVSPSVKAYRHLRLQAAVAARHARVFVDSFLKSGPRQSRPGPLGS